jgi:alpha-beta hydrolase superfamily lysophospholipase
MEDIESVEQFIVMNYLHYHLIKTDDIYIIGHSKGGVSALLCTQYDTKIKSMYLASPFDFHRSWNSKFRTVELMVFSTLKC